ncbi:hypothetical protein FOPE_10064 [Fonsecaea pedrosoi]|nr:hypothetical protein FOPE_10064 [Fonsecaea pedrosoi]
MASKYEVYPSFSKERSGQQEAVKIPCRFGDGLGRGLLSKHDAKCHRKETTTLLSIESRRTLYEVRCEGKKRK